MGDRIGAVTLLVAVVLGLASVPAHAGTDAATAVPPVCSTAQDFNTWASANNQSLKIGFLGDKGAVPLGWVGVGAANFSCAAQMHELDKVCDGTVIPCTTQAIGFETHANGTAFPDTVDAAGGDGQNVHIAIPEAVSKPAYAAADWGQCMPARTYYPGFCDASELNQSVGNGYAGAGGLLLYRFRDNTGTFSGPWWASDGQYSPGFVIKRPGNLSPCTATMNACDYEVDFTRTTANKPVNTADAQVLLVFNVTVPNPAWAGAPPGTLYTQPIAIPMLIVQSGGVAPKPAESGGAGGSSDSAPTVIPVAGSSPTSSLAFPLAKKSLKPRRRGAAAIPSTVLCSATSCAVRFKAPNGVKSTKATMLRGKTKVASATRAKKGTLKLTPKSVAAGNYTIRLDVVTKSGKTVSMTVSFKI